VKAPRIAFVGRHNGGKTTFLVKVLPFLVADGIRVGYVKHAHAGFEIDNPKKDSYRARHTGVLQTIVVGGGKLAVVDDGWSEDELTHDAAHARHGRDDLDLIVVEGFKAEPLPKIEVARAALSTELLCLNDRNLVATVTDFEVSPAVPHFGLDDAQAVADFIVARIGR
jgi:molybdopterin-guanine dinucleotide biosynthesis protein MobB